MAELAVLWRDCFEMYTAMAGTIVPGANTDRHERMYAALEHQAEHFHQKSPLKVEATRRSSFKSKERGWGE